MTQEKSKTRPLYRVSFVPYIENGDEKSLGQAREIGAVWPRKDKPGGILRLEIIPDDLRGGVIFLSPNTKEGAR